MNNINLGVDYHDTFSFAPQFFLTLFGNWPGKRYIVTGTPEKEREETLKTLKDKYNCILDRDFEGLLMGYNWDRKDGLDESHFKKMRERKLKNILKYDIGIFYDDNPYYVSYLKDKGIITFQIILPQKYTEEFAKNDPYFTCHLQDRQFDFVYKDEK